VKRWSPPAARPPQSRSWASPPCAAGCGTRLGVGAAPATAALLASRGRSGVALDTVPGVPDHEPWASGAGGPLLAAGIATAVLGATVLAWCGGALKQAVG